MARTTIVRTVWPLALLLGGALAFVVVRAPDRIHRVEMASETDGVHQDDHVYFGLLPYSTQRHDSSLRVTTDAFHVLERAGVPDVTESHRRLPSYPVMRLIYPDRTEYCVSFELGKKSPKDVADQYARNLSKAVRRSNRAVESVQGLCPDGKTRLDFTVFKGATTPAQLRFWTVP